MKLLVLLGILLPAVYGVTLEYDTQITSFSFSWKNPDADANAENTGPSDSAIVSDGDITTGEVLTNPGPNANTWGETNGNTDGMTGDFAAATLYPGTGNSHWSISSASITFGGDGCWGDSSTAEAYYVDTDGNRAVLGDAILSSGGGGYTFTAPIPATGVATNGAIGFVVETNLYCEGSLTVNEFELEGVTVATKAPTKGPTKGPTTPPTPGPTKGPTMAPTQQCKGEVTWGDPHYTLTAMHKDANQFNYQGLGWYYYLAPCDIQNGWDTWPFFLLSEHEYCQWRGQPKGCIDNNKLILNTKPVPWEITFTDNGFSIVAGTDAANQQASDFNTNRNYKERDPLVIEYNDGQSNPQYGELRIFYDSGAIVLQLHSVAFNGYPRTCNKGVDAGIDCGDYMCNDKVIEIRNSGSWTAFSCPTCLRNIACGLMGKYTRGDCTDAMLRDSSSPCYSILVGSDGTVHTPPTSDAVFEGFADSWEKSEVDAEVASHGLTVNFLKNQKQDLNPIHAVKEGRAFSMSANADGDCLNNVTRVAEVNETCRLNTVVQYEKCCKEIGICKILWDACVEDLCACDSKDTIFNSQQCLDVIIHDSMNTSCGYDALYPTATPTNAPTPSPVGLISGLPQGKKAEDLIWLYLIFVVLFVLIAGVAYWYYRKKNVGKVIMDEDDDMEMNATGATYSHD